MNDSDTNNLNNNKSNDINKINLNNNKSKDNNKLNLENIDYIKQNNTNNLYSLIKIFIIFVLYLIIYYFLGKFIDTSVLNLINFVIIFFVIVFVIVNFINYFFNFNILKELYYVIFNIKYEDEVVNKLLNSIIIFNNVSNNDSNNDSSNNIINKNNKNNKNTDFNIDIDNSGLLDDKIDDKIDDEINELKSISEKEEKYDISNIVMNKEVFHIPGSRFTFNDANAICKSMNSDLATYEQVQKSQKEGSNWCSYGWSQDQLALYPTSQSKFDELSKNDKTKYDCGFVGVNGMYVNNPYMKFGANCYGVKPKKSDLELKHSEVSDYKPKTAKEVILEDRIEYWKRRLGNVLIAPFNKDKWYNVE